METVSVSDVAVVVGDSVDEVVDDDVVVGTLDVVELSTAAHEAEAYE